MKKALLGGVALVALALPGIAQAADLPLRRAPIATAPVPVWTWTGCYVGGHVGSGWGNKIWEDRGGDDISDNTSYGTTGFLGGVQVGCDYQWGVVVLGAEGSFSWTNIKGTGSLPFEPEPSTITTKIDWLTTAAGRIGFTADKALIYAKAGAAWVREKHTLTELDEGVAASVTIDSKRVGWLFGAGIEYMIAPNWSAKLEYNYIDFGTKDVLFTGLADDPASVKQQLHTIKFGLNYRFYTW
jgi:outer membrane immunogenic protein